MASVSRLTPSASMPLNDIPVRQNTSPMLDLLRAKSSLYDASQAWYRRQFCLVVITSVILALLKTFVPALKPVADVASLLLVVLDVLVMDPRQEKLRSDGAVMQELFDCEVLSLPFRTEIVSRPAGERIHQWAVRHPSLDGLRNWYSPVVGQLPLPLARVACQRSGAYWSAELRERYALYLRGAAGSLVVAVLIVSLVAGASVGTMGSWLVTILAVLTWCLREAHRQVKAASAARALVARADALWMRTLKGEESDAVLTQAARELQTDIYNQRKGSPMMFDWLYRSARARDESAMHAGIQHRLAEYDATQRLSTAAR